MAYTSSLGIFSGPTWRKILAGAGRKDPLCWLSLTCTSLRPVLSVPGPTTPLSNFGKHTVTAKTGEMAETVDATQAEPSSASARMLFIVSSNVEKADPVTRKRIRSHVARGKKPQKGPPYKSQRPAGRTHATARLDVETVAKAYASLLPCRVGGELSVLEFPDEMETSMLLNLSRFPPVAMTIVFPLMMAIGFRAGDKVSCALAGNTAVLMPPASDLAALHITAFAVEEFTDRILRPQKYKANPAAMLNLQRGLKLLRERLLGDDDQAKVSNSTIGAVSKLASSAHVDGDYPAAKHHMDGLRKMLDLRGGPDAFRGEHLLTEILRTDLSVALLNGSDPVFYYQPAEPVIDYPEQLQPAFKSNSPIEDETDVLRDVDSNLVTAWRAMRRFCMLVNLGDQTQRFIQPDIIHETMVAVIYRLLHMSFAFGTVDETVRLALLAFCHHIFLQWQDIKLPYPHFPTLYKSCIQAYDTFEGISSPFMLWMLMIGAISLFDEFDEAWLEQSWREHVSGCHVKTWKDTQRLLGRFMWIGLLDDSPGKQIFDRLHTDKKKWL